MLTIQRVHNALRAVQSGKVSGVSLAHINSVYMRAHVTEFFDDHDTYMVEYIEAMERKNERRSKLRVVQ